MAIPESKSCVQVSIIDSTVSVKGFPTAMILDPPEITGWQPSPFIAFSFLIEHPSGRKVLYDLGMRRDIQNSPPATVALLSGPIEVTVERDVPDTLQANGMKLEEIEALVPSHWHFEHIGHAGRYPPSAAMIVGPGFKDVMLPGYPENPESMIHTADFRYAAS